MDNQDVFELFDQNVPYELRLRDAIINDLVVPFKYYGIRDSLVDYGLTAKEERRLISPFMYNAPETFAEYPELWDIAYTMYTNTLNYGLNCEITVGCDLTDFIVEQRAIFQTVIQRQVAAIALRTLAMNPNVRVNRNQSNASKMEILYELDGNVEGRPGGLGYDLKKAFEALRLDTQGIDRICLSCNNRGVKYRTT